MVNPDAVPSKARLPNVDGALPKKYALVRLEQYRNAEMPKLVTLSGMMTLVRLLHPQNAALPILVTLFPMTALVRLVQRLKA
jgi:hypothetical protein